MYRIYLVAFSFRVVEVFNPEVRRWSGSGSSEGEIGIEIGGSPRCFHPRAKLRLYATSTWLPTASNLQSTISSSLRINFSSN